MAGGERPVQAHHPRLPRALSHPRPPAVVRALLLPERLRRCAPLSPLAPTSHACAPQTHPRVNAMRQRCTRHSRVRLHLRRPARTLAQPTPCMCCVTHTATVMHPPSTPACCGRAPNHAPADARAHSALPSHAHPEAHITSNPVLIAAAGHRAPSRRLPPVPSPFNGYHASIGQPT